MRAPLAARLALAALALSALAVGIPATVAPEAFFEDFPFAREWVVLLPPYNEHLVTDVGALYLGFAVPFVFAAVRPSATLVRPLCAGWALAAVLHFSWHLANLGPFGTLDAVAQSLSLALVLALPGLAAWSVGPAPVSPRA